MVVGSGKCILGGGWWWWVMVDLLWVVGLF